MISRKFIKTSAIYTLAGALPIASATILIPFYILYLPTATYGALTVCLVFSTLVQILVTYSFDTSIYIHYHELRTDREKLGSFISSAFIFMLALGLMVSILLIFGGELLFSYAWKNGALSFYPYGLISVGIGVFQAIFKVHGGLLQTREKPEPFLWSNVALFGIVAITTVVGLKMFPNTLIGPLGGRLLATCVCGFWALGRVFGEFGWHFKSPWKSTSFSFNAFTFVYQVQQWVINYFDRVLILFFMPLSTAASLTAVGLYDFAQKCLAPIELLLNGLNTSINPKIVKLIIQQVKKGSSIEINRYFYGLLAVILLSICVSIVGLPVVFDLFIRDNKYEDALPYIPYLSLVFIFKAVRIYLVIPYNTLKKMDRLTILNFLVMLLKIGIMFMLVSKWGVYGVITSSYLAFSVEMILLWYYLKEDYVIRFNFIKLLGIPMLLFTLIVLLEPVVGASYPLSVHSGYVILCVLALWTAYRRELMALDFSKILK